MFKIMGITNILCQALQSCSQDILNVMHLIYTSKLLFQQLRIGGWSNLVENVKLFCLKHEIEIPDMSAHLGRGRSRQPNISMKHHCRVNTFLIVIDSQMKKLNLIFSEEIVELLRSSTTLDPSDNYKEFNIDNICMLACSFYCLDFIDYKKVHLYLLICYINYICRLVETFYTSDFSEHKRIHMRLQLSHYIATILQYFQYLTILSEFCKKLIESRKSKCFHFINRLISFVLTLSISTATIERAFSLMKNLKKKHKQNE